MDWPRNLPVDCQGSEWYWWWYWCWWGCWWGERNLRVRAVVVLQQFLSGVLLGCCFGLFLCCGACCFFVGCLFVSGTCYRILAGGILLHVSSPGSLFCCLIETRWCDGSSFFIGCHWEVYSSSFTLTFLSLVTWLKALGTSRKKKERVSCWELILARLGPGLFWAILGRQGDRRGPNLNSDVKNPYVWVQIDGLRGVFWATISRFVGIQTLYWGDVGPFWRPKLGDKCHIKARNWQKRPRRRFQKTRVFFGNLRVFFWGAFVIILGFLEPSWAMLERHLWVVRSHVGPVLVVLSFCCSVFCLSTVFHTAFYWETFQYLSEYRIY